MSDQQREVLQTQLVDVILRVLMRHSQLHYYQVSVLVYYLPLKNPEHKKEWNDDETNQEILERSGASILSEEVKRRRWKFIGHILRQDPNNYCNVACMTWAPEGNRKRGRPKQPRGVPWRVKGLINFLSLSYNFVVVLFQGYHDIVVTFLLVVGKDLSYALVDQLSTHHLR